MRENHEINKNSEIMNAYYKMIGEAHIQNINEELIEKNDNIQKGDIPETLDKWFDEFHRKWKRKKDRKAFVKKYRKISVRVAVFLAVFISVMSIITISVEAIRIKVFNFFMEKHDQYTEIQVVEDKDILVPVIEAEQYYYLTYVPNGYLFSDATILENSIFMVYTNESEQIYFSQTFGSTDYQLNTEDASVENVVIGDEEGILIINKNVTMLFWHEDNITFLLEGNISKNEILLIADKIKKNE